MEYAQIRSSASCTVPTINGETEIEHLERLIEEAKKKVRSLENESTRSWYAELNGDMLPGMRPDSIIKKDIDAEKANQAKLEQKLKSIVNPWEN